VSSVKVIKTNRKKSGLPFSGQSELFNFIVNQAPAVVTVVDEKGIKTILGYDYKKRIGKNFLKSRFVHPEDVPIKEKLIEKAYAYPNKNIKDELRIKHKNGNWNWVEVTFNNQLKNPYIQGIIVITHDITERKCSEIEKNEFLGIASHELKTPLTTIRAFSQLLITKLSKEEDKRKEVSFLEKIISQTDKITSLINDLLDVGKIQEGKLTVHFASINLYSIIAKLVEDFRITRTSHEIILKGSKKMIVFGDENRIGQVINNLFTNALKYSPPSSEIAIRVAKRGAQAVVSIADQGIGIPKNKQKYVFQRFFRVEDSKTPQVSSGLGLYIASEIIKLHKGEIWLKSEKGKGSTFYFSLPISLKFLCDTSFG